MAPAETRVKEEQWRQLQALAHEIAAELGKRSGGDETRAVFRRFNREFGLTTYKKLPRRRFSEGLAFLTTWRDEMVAAAPTRPYATFSDYPVLSHNRITDGKAEIKPLGAPARLEVVTSAPMRPSALFPGYRVLSPDRVVHEKTEMEFVRVPAGPFIYGEGKTQRTIELQEFWIGRAPVTNAQYKQFVDATSHEAPYYWRDGKSPASMLDHPVTSISWKKVVAFCDWAGLTLPAEEQWEKAARGSDGRIWPWGNQEPTDNYCNFGNIIGSTTPVGKYSPQGNSPYGCVDMVGNVWEWTSSWQVENDSANHVVRGGSWWDEAYYCRCALRWYSPIFRLGVYGFRALAASSGHL
jgi:formylglycine-generating enzyme required for sulfatase activity